MATALTPPLPGSTATLPRQSKPYDFLLKFLLVGDSDVGKEEILSGLIDGSSESPYGTFTDFVAASVCRTVVEAVVQTLDKFEDIFVSS